MNLFLVNILLAMLWSAVSGQFSFGGLLVGFALGFGVLWICRSLFSDQSYFGRFWYALDLLLFVLVDMVKSNLRVAADVVTPRLRARPVILSIPTDAQSDWELAAMANLISLNPGVLTLDVSDDRRIIYVHAMYAGDAEAVRHVLAAGLGRRVAKVFR